MRYNPKRIETKWQKTWKREGIYRMKDRVRGRENFYHLVMFPYPSGNLHIGHWYNFTPADVYARYMRMQSHNVLSPIGFDAFGLPAENAAIKRRIHPKKWTDENIAYMRRQLESMGNTYDWSREVNTSRPEYYKWTQWLFLLLYKRGLAYRAKAPANWCPSCKTILANEQVENGRCFRCGHVVEQKEVMQWMFRITAYAERLLQDLDELDWPEETKIMQRNWIGKSEGAEIEFGVVGREERISVFTTRADTLFGATYLVLSPEYPLVNSLTSETQRKAVQAYQTRARRKTELERVATGKRAKSGVFTGAYAVNPVNGEEIPVWIADYVLMRYGTGAIMAVPAHDERDFAFAQKYRLPIKYVIDPVTGSSQHNPEHKEKIVAVVENKKGEVLTINWGPTLGGRLLIGGTVEKGEDSVEAAKREIAEETGYRNVVLRAASDEKVHHEYFAPSKGKAFIAHTRLLHFSLENGTKSRRALEDTERGKFSVEWVSKSRAREEIRDPLHRYAFDKFIEGRCYTGEGILANSGQFNGIHSPQARREIVRWLHGGGFAREKVEYRLRDWIISRQRYWGTPIPIVYCPVCGEVPVPERDLPVKLPDIKDFTPSRDGRSPLAKAASFVNTRCPKCKGKAERETDTIDTFIDSSWYYFRYTDPHNRRHFAAKNKIETWMPIDMYVGGKEHTVLHLLYSRFFTKVLYDSKLVPFTEPFRALRHQGIILGPDGQKMSKSRGNVVDPDVLVRAYGADTVRIYLCFMGPYHLGGPWNPRGIEGVHRFLGRIWGLFEHWGELSRDPMDDATEQLLHQTIRKVGDDFAHFRFNTAVSALMIYLNRVGEVKNQAAAAAMLPLLAPLVPHMAEEIWRNVLGHTSSIHTTPWPKFDTRRAQARTLTMVVQVNGKVRDRITVQQGISEDEAATLAAKSARVQEYTRGKKEIRRVFVTDRLINIVVQ